MTRGRMVSALLLTVVCALSMVAVPASATPGEYSQNQFGRSPSILRSGATYYRYVDGFDYGGAFIIPVFTSPDLVTWTWIGNAMTTADVGAWADPSSGANFAAPSVLEISSNSFVLYYTAKQVGTGRQCIGHATASSPGGPFDAADQPMICASSGASEPSAVPLIAGAPYQQLVFRQPGGIFVQVLTPDGLSVHPSAPTPSLIFGSPGAERPGVVWGPNATPYLLFSSIDPVTQTRVAGAVKCTQGFGLIGSCTANPVDGGRWFGSTHEVVSPGRVQAFSYGTEQWIVYQASPAGSCSGAACLTQGSSYVDKLCFANGKPRTNAPTIGASVTRNSNCATDIPSDWQTTWMSPTDGPFWNTHPEFPNETLRQLAHTTTGGSAVRVKLSNVQNTVPLTIGAATVAVSAAQQGATPAVVAPIRTLTFGGSAGITIPAGAEVVSDAVPLNVPGDHDIAISLHIPQWPNGYPNNAGHAFAPETSFVGGGNLVGELGSAAQFPAQTCDGITCNANFVTSVQVLAAGALGSIVAIGDSLTDGLFNTHGRDDATMWPEVVHTLMRGEGMSQASIGDTAIAGETLLPASDPMSLQGRFDRDVLGHTGVRTVILEIGANDIYDGKSATEIVAGLQAVVDRAKAAGLRVLGATIPPYAWRSANVRFENPVCYSANPVPTQGDLDREAQRIQVNNSIRSGQVTFDAVLDFDEALRDTTDPRRPKEEYLSWDCVHLTASGQAALADSIPLTALLP